MMRILRVCVAPLLFAVLVAASNGQERIEFSGSPLQGTLFAEDAATGSREKTEAESVTLPIAPGFVDGLTTEVAGGKGNFKAHSDSPERLGGLANPQQFEIVGNAAFSSDSIRLAVSRDVHLSWCGFPAASRSYYLHHLGRAVAEGYLYAGYAQVFVSADASDDKSHLVVTIREGNRCTASAVRVQSNARPVEQNVESEIVRALTAPSSPALHHALRDADWDVTRPASFSSKKRSAANAWRAMCELQSPIKADRESLLAYQRCVELACADLGYPYAAVRAHWRSSGKSAILEISIRDLGPRVGFKQLRLEGQKRTSVAEVVQFLGLEAGASLAPQALADLVSRLENSGRFLAVSAHLERLPGNDDVELVVEVQEAPRSPALNEKFSEAEAALLRFSEWLAAPDRWEADLVAELQVGEREFQFVLAPTGAMALAEQGSHGEAEERPWALIDSQQIALNAPKSRSLWSLSVDTSSTPAVYLSLGLKLYRTDPERRALQTGVRLSSDQQLVAPPKLELAPSFCLDLLRRPGVTAKLSDGTWTVTDPGKDRFVFENDTGRGVSWECWVDDEAPAGGAPNLYLRWEAGALDHRSAQLTRAMARYPNRGDPDRPVRSLVEFVFAEVMAGAEAPPPAGVRLLGQASVAFADELVSGWWRVATSRIPRDTECFWIPSDAAQAVRHRSDWGSWYLAIASTSDELIPRETAAGGLLRYGCRLACEDLFEPSFRALCENTALGELNCLFQPEAPTGPLVGWLVAQMFDDPPKVVQHVLTRMDDEHFRSDCSGFVDQRGLVGRAVGKAAETLRGADDESWAQLFELLPEEHRPSCRSFANALLRDRDQPIEPAFLEALVAGWRGGWRAAVEADLRTRDTAAE